jgi:uncharacterized phage protein (TIGR01671 family)
MEDNVTPPKREIKFRIWAKDSMSSLGKEEMVYLPKWTVFDGRDLVFREDLETFWIDSSSSGDAILMQYTGLQDKNEEHIYEGDILKCYHKDYYNDGETFFNHVITFEDGSFWGINEDCCLPKDCEVIGNIYENPELL